ncbi:hypothetical protein P154DRAFT_579356 [Amniculicola lignicola CBS 123094]|uniref:Uncharacterized protein n=1 Tax=Amniculicola lignicola CBS 123094 TaxID=1392246 RepID=A0A6A5W7E2_9PLEO|nr:hypothetical protein P154DRAFT_579356 [Amniculicola lignicola CBS 123094]
MSATASTSGVGAPASSYPFLDTLPHGVEKSLNFNRKGVTDNWARTHDKETEKAARMYFVRYGICPRLFPEGHRAQMECTSIMTTTRKFKSARTSSWKITRRQSGTRRYDFTTSILRIRKTDGQGCQGTQGRRKERGLNEKQGKGNTEVEGSEKQENSEDEEKESDLILDHAEAIDEVSEYVDHVAEAPQKGMNVKAITWYQLHSWIMDRDVLDSSGFTDDEVFTMGDAIEEMMDAEEIPETALNHGKQEVTKDADDAIEEQAVRHYYAKYRVCPALFEDGFRAADLVYLNDQADDETRKAKIQNLKEHTDGFTDNPIYYYGPKQDRPVALV